MSQYKSPVLQGPSLTFFYDPTDIHMEYLILNEKVNLCWRLKAFRVNHAIALRCR